jgi:hypothetical protein
MLLRLASATFILALAASPALGQTERGDTVSAGQRVRLRTEEGGKWQKGTVAETTPDALTLELDGSAVTLGVRLAEISELEVSRGQRSNFLPGLGWGFFAGAVIGGIVGFASGDDPPGWFSMTAGEKAAAGAIGFGALGALVGGISGALTHSDRWEPVDLENVVLTLSPRYDGGVSLSLNYSF